MSKNEGNRLSQFRDDNSLSDKAESVGLRLKVGHYGGEIVFLFQGVAEDDSYECYSLDTALAWIDGYVLGLGRVLDADNTAPSRSLCDQEAQADILDKVTTALEKAVNCYAIDHKEFRAVLNGLDITNNAFAGPAPEVPVS